MTIKKTNITDGLFTYERVVIQLNEEHTLETEQACDDILLNMRNVEHQLGQVENKIKKLLEAPQFQSTRTSPKLKKSLGKCKELDQVRGYAKQASDYLKMARINLEKRDTAQAIIDTIFMMDAYWRAFMHTERIKTPIVLDLIQTPGKKRGGDMTGKKKTDSAKPEHDRIRELAKSLPGHLTCAGKAEILRRKHGIKLCARQITTILKEPEKTP